MIAPSSPSSSRRWWSRTLARRLFVWFGVIILASAALTGVVGFVLFQLGFASPWRVEVERVRPMVDHELSRAWDEPVSRAALVDEIARELDAGVELRDFGGAVLERSGFVPKTRRGCRRLPVRHDGVALGMVVVCRRPASWLVALRLGLMALTVGLLLWAAAWWLARSLARPLEELSQVAEQIGSGKLAARVKVSPASGVELERLGGAVNEMAARIEAQLRAERTLLAEVSHELRTPLGHMRLLIELGAHQGGLTPTQCDDLEREVWELDELVDQLLATSRLNFELGEHRALGLVALVIEALERAGISPEVLDVTLSPACEVQGDAMLLRRALANVLRNATTHGGGVERVAVERSGERGVAVWIEDCGPGLDAAQLEALALPFVQGSGAQAGSLGLGLSLVRRVAQAHGAQVSVRERPEGGASVGIVWEGEG